MLDEIEILKDAYESEYKELKEALRVRNELRRTLCKSVEQRYEQLQKQLPKDYKFDTYINGWRIFISSDKIFYGDYEQFDEMPIDSLIILYDEYDGIVERIIEDLKARITQFRIQRRRVRKNIVTIRKIIGE